MDFLEHYNLEEATKKKSPRKKPSVRKPKEASIDDIDITKSTDKFSKLMSGSDIPGRRRSYQPKRRYSRRYRDDYYNDDYGYRSGRRPSIKSKPSKLRGFEMLKDLEDFTPPKDFYKSSSKKDKKEPETKNTINRWGYMPIEKSHYRILVDKWGEGKYRTPFKKGKVSDGYVYDLQDGNFIYLIGIGEKYFIVFDGKSSINKAISLGLVGKNINDYVNLWTSLSPEKYNPIDDESKTSEKEPNVVVKPTSKDIPPVEVKSVDVKPKDTPPRDPPLKGKRISKTKRDEILAKKKEKKMNFSEYYDVDKFIESEFMDNDVITEDFLGIGALTKGAFNLLGAAGGAAIRAYKSKPIKINNFNKYLNTEKTYQVSFKTYQAVNVLAADNLIIWRQHKKKSGWFKRVIDKLKQIFVVERYSGVLSPNLDDSDEFREIFTDLNLDENFIVHDISIYKLSNGGHIVTMAILNDFTDESFKGIQATDKKKPKKLNQQLLQESNYYVGIDDKAEKWFSDMTGMGFKQSLAVYSKYSEDSLSDEIKSRREFLGAKPVQYFYSKTISKKSRYEEIQTKFVEKAKEDKALKSSENLKDYDGKMYNLKNKGRVSFFKSGNEYKVMANQKAFDYILKNKIDVSRGYDRIEKE